MTPTKTWGQNFVHDAGTVRKIVRSAGVREGQHIIEVGPGLGSLTLGLLEAGALVTAVEIDPRLAAQLPHTVAEFAPDAADRLSVINADALRVTAQDVAAANSAGASKGTKIAAPNALVANLPYNVSVPILLHFLATFESLDLALVMVQAEVADRLAAPPGSRTYGVPSVKAAWYGNARRAATIGRGVFWPVPNVDSALVHIERTAPPPTAAPRDQVFAVIDAAFAQRRKTIRKALSAIVDNSDMLDRALSDAGVDPAARGEALAVTDFARLTDHLVGAGARFDVRGTPHDS